MHMRSVASGADYRQNFPALTSVPTENELISACSECDGARKHDSQLQALATNLGIKR